MPSTTCSSLPPPASPWRASKPSSWGSGAEDDGWATGFTVGAGIEAKLADNWSARLEYLYINYGEEDLELDPVDDTFDFEDVHAIRAGVAYHF